jgi:hypothetical protein
MRLHIDNFDHADQLRIIISTYNGRYKYQLHVNSTKNNKVIVQSNVSKI